MATSQERKWPGLWEGRGARGYSSRRLGDVTPQWGRSERSKGQQWLELLQLWGVSYLWLALSAVL